MKLLVLIEGDSFLFIFERFFFFVVLTDEHHQPDPLFTMAAFFLLLLRLRFLKTRVTKARSVSRFKRRYLKLDTK